MEVNIVLEKLIWGTIQETTKHMNMLSKMRYRVKALLQETCLGKMLFKRSWEKLRRFFIVQVLKFFAWCFEILGILFWNRISGCSIVLICATRSFVFGHKFCMSIEVSFILYGFAAHNKLGREERPNNMLMCVPESNERQQQKLLLQHQIDIGRDCGGSLSIVTNNTFELSDTNPAVSKQQKSNVSTDLDSF